MFRCPLILNKTIIYISVNLFMHIFRFSFVENALYALLLNYT
jgi:hypothetical protein